MSKKARKLLGNVKSQLLYQLSYRATAEQQADSLRAHSITSVIVHMPLGFAAVHCEGVGRLSGRTCPSQKKVIEGLPCRCNPFRRNHTGVGD